MRDALEHFDSFSGSFALLVESLEAAGVSLMSPSHDDALPEAAPRDG
ncbi:hypothetical protein [Lysobacter arvi]|uniref:Uncharacterized protein n=1 Tax=Lysobacter arvi TaxID=3038776 RepID=A0ABU1CE01_9GAMM|nr:hypothetical protein [Lysobacter arvi]MDR0183402.1 hypothetical protein [Lysobacter arvi]